MGCQKILILCAFAGLIAGCGTTSVVIGKDAEKKTREVVIQQAANSYEVSKSSWCSSSCTTADCNCQQDYPVSYRTKQWDDDSNRVEYIYTPRNLVPY